MSAVVRALTSILLFLILPPMTAGAQQTADKPASHLPVGWIQAPSRQQDDGLWHCAAYGGSWVVRNDDGGIMLRTFDPKAEKQQPIPPELRLSKKMIGRRSLQATSSGWLVGFDAGEFGGGLWWFSRDGSKTIKLLSENVHALHKTSAGILILAGLNHMGLNYGQLYKFIDIPERAAAMSLAELDGAPEASIVDANGNIIVATPRSVLRVDTEGQVHELYRSEEYLTYPTSAAVDPNGNIYVAMRFFVLRLIPQGATYKSEWLMSEKCRSIKLDHYICTCNGRGIQTR